MLQSDDKEISKIQEEAKFGNDEDLNKKIKNIIYSVVRNSLSS